MALQDNMLVELDFSESQYLLYESANNTDIASGVDFSSAASGTYGDRPSGTTEYSIGVTGGDAASTTLSGGVYTIDAANTDADVFRLGFNVAGVFGIGETRYAIFDLKITSITGATCLLKVTDNFVEYINLSSYSLGETHRVVMPITTTATQLLVYVELNIGESVEFELSNFGIYTKRPATFFGDTGEDVGDARIAALGGYAMQGDGAHRYAKLDNLPLTSDFSIAVVAKLEASGASRNLFDTRDGGLDGFYFGTNAANQLLAFIGDGATNDTLVIPAGDAVDGQYHAITYTQSGGASSLYLDDAEVDTGSSVPSLAVSAAAYLGRYGASAIGFLGASDAVAALIIWDRAISAAEVAEVVAAYAPQSTELLDPSLVKSSLATADGLALKPSLLNSDGSIKRSLLKSTS